MTREIKLSATSALIVGFSIAAAGMLVGGGAFLGGYALGERDAPEAVQVTELAEKTYTVEDLQAALDACEVEDAAVEDGAVTLVGAEHSPMKRQCFVLEMGAPALAEVEYAWDAVNTRTVYYLDGGEYWWSNVHMVWEQTDDGRDVTITVE